MGGIAKAIGKVVSGVAEAVGDVVEVVAENPIIAATVFAVTGVPLPGVLASLPAPVSAAAISMASTAIQGGDFGDIIKAGAAGAPGSPTLNACANAEAAAGLIAALSPVTATPGAVRLVGAGPVLCVVGCPPNPNAEANVGSSASDANLVAAGPAEPTALSTMLGLYCILGKVSNVCVNGDVGDHCGDV